MDGSAEIPPGIFDQAGGRREGDVHGEDNTERSIAGVRDAGADLFRFRRAVVRAGYATLKGNMTSGELKINLPKKPKRVLLNANHDVLAAGERGEGSAVIPNGRGWTPMNADGKTEPIDDGARGGR